MGIDDWYFSESLLEEYARIVLNHNDTFQSTKNAST